MDGRTIGAQDARWLVQGAPPFDGELDDRHVDEADQCDDAGNAGGALGLLDGLPDRHVTEV